MRLLVKTVGAIAFTALILGAAEFAMGQASPDTTDLLKETKVEKITYNSQKGIYKVHYWSSGDSTFYTVPLFPGDKHIPNTEASVTRENEGEYTYKYFLSNSDNSLREIYSFSVLVKSQVYDLQNPNNEWRGSYVGWMNKARWVQTNSESDTVGILPGKSVKGVFTFNSNEIPGISNAITSSYIGLGNTLDEGPTGRIRRRVDSLLRTDKNVTVKTIAPKKLPENISNIALIDTLQSYLTFSCDTTWIANKGVCRSLEAKLDNVDRQLEQGRDRTAANSLQALLNELNALKEKQISSEAYGLLYFNGQFLLDKLKE